MQSLFGSLDPLSEPMSLPTLRLDQHDPRCLHEQNAQVAVAPLGYLAENCAIASRHLLWHEAQPQPPTREPYPRRPTPGIAPPSFRRISRGIQNSYSASRTTNLLPSRFLSLKAFGRRPRCKPHRRHGPASETLNIFDRSTMSARCPLSTRSRPNCCITASDVTGHLETCIL